VFSFISYTPFVFFLTSVFFVMIITLFIRQIEYMFDFYCKKSFFLLTEKGSSTKITLERMFWFSF